MGGLMAKKARKKSPAKRGKKSKAKAKARVTKKAKPAARKKKARHRSATIGQQLSRGLHTVVETVTGTEKLRDKMELPGTDATE